MSDPDDLRHELDRLAAAKGWQKQYSGSTSAHYAAVHDDAAVNTTRYEFERLAGGRIRLRVRQETYYPPAALHEVVEVESREFADMAELLRGLS